MARIYFVSTWKIIAPKSWHQVTANLRSRATGYLRGRELYRRAESSHLDKTRECFEHAICIDANYALAYAGLTVVFVDTYLPAVSSITEIRTEGLYWVGSVLQQSNQAIFRCPPQSRTRSSRNLRVG